MTNSHQKDKRDKKTLLVGAVLVFCVGAYFVSKSFFWTNSNSHQTQEETVVNNKKENTPLVAPDVLLKKIQNGDKIAIIDVRTEIAFENGHIAHATFLPIGSLQNFSPEKDESVVIVYSVADTQTFETAKNIMIQKSFPYFFLQGGFEEWKNMNAPLVSIGDPNSFLDQSKVTYIKLEIFKKLQSEKKASFFILDVQSKENYKKKHVMGAVNIPLEEVEKRIGEIPAGQQIIVYGENDVISFQGGVRLSDLGVFMAQTLTGNKYLSLDSGLIFEP